MSATEEARVVVGLDASDESRHALQWAADHARRYDAVLEVVHAWREPMVFIPKVYPAGLVEMGRMDDAVRSFVATELGNADIESQAVTITPMHGRAAPALLERAEGASLVVVGRRGIGGHPLLGGTAEHIARHASCPVAVVPSSPSTTHRKVLVGVDASENASTALRWAFSDANRRGAQLVALLAWTLLDQPPPPGGAPFDPHYSDETARLALSAAIAEALDGDADAVERRVICDVARYALVQASGGADLVVCGRRGLGGFKGLLLGSVSRYVLEHARCPVVVVHASNQTGEEQ